MEARMRTLEAQLNGVTQSREIHEIEREEGE